MSLPCRGCGRTPCPEVAFEDPEYFEPLPSISTPCLDGEPAPEPTESGLYDVVLP